MVVHISKRIALLLCVATFISAGKNKFTYFNKLPVDLQRAIFLQAGNAYEQLQLIDAFLLVSKRLNKRIFGYRVPRRKGKMATVGAEIELESKNKYCKGKKLLFDYETKVVSTKGAQKKESFLEQYHIGLAKQLEKYLVPRDLGFQVSAQFPLSACCSDGNALALRVFLHPRFKKFLIRTQRWRIRPGINSGNPGWIVNPFIGKTRNDVFHGFCFEDNKAIVEVLKTLPGTCIIEGLSVVTLEGVNNKDSFLIKMQLPKQKVKINWKDYT